MVLVIRVPYVVLPSDFAESATIQRSIPVTPTTATTTSTNPSTYHGEDFDAFSSTFPEDPDLSRRDSTVTV